MRILINKWRNVITEYENRDTINHLFQILKRDFTSRKTSMNKLSGVSHAEISRCFSPPGQLIKTVFNVTSFWVNCRLHHFVLQIYIVERISALLSNFTKLQTSFPSNKIAISLSLSLWKVCTYTVTRIAQLSTLPSLAKSFAENFQGKNSSPL